MRTRLIFAIMLLGSVAGVLAACGGATDGFSSSEWATMHTLSPLPAAPSPDPTNKYADDPRAARLGQMLFFDKELSGPLTLDSDLGKKGTLGKAACSVCHTPQAWFQDVRGTRTSIGANQTFENNISTVDVAFLSGAHPSWDGHADSYWAQAIGALETEVGGDRVSQARTIAKKYRAEYEAIFGALDAGLAPGAHDPRFPAGGAKPLDDASDPMQQAWEKMAPADQVIVNRVLVNEAKSIEAYLRLQVSREAPFDRYVAGDLNAISASAKRGLKLFMGKASCIECHHGPMFSDEKYHVTGIAEAGDAAAGVPDEDPGPGYGAFELALNDPFNSDSAYSDATNTGRIAALRASAVNAVKAAGKYRTQPLRHVAETAPYMHSGQLKTLHDVVDFYDKGGESEGFLGDKDPKIKKLNLSETEVDDLVEFLKTLTGQEVAQELRTDTSRR